MPIVGSHPESGVRVNVERPQAGGPPWCYEGDAVTPNASYRVTANVSASGDVEVVLAADAPKGLADKTRRVLRSAWKHAQTEGEPPPRHIVRWRPEGPTG
jgi:hypothetical protein